MNRMLSKENTARCIAKWHEAMCSNPSTVQRGREKGREEGKYEARHWWLTSVTLTT
jgi:hypothetical protein